MLSIGTVTSSGGAARYYNLRGHAGEGVAQSSWHGAAKLTLGLSAGSAIPQEFENVLNGRSACGEPLTARAATAQDRQLGIDLTFSAPKSVSILLQGKEGPKLRKLLWSSNHAAMDYVQSKLVQTRVTNPDTRQRQFLSNQKIVYLSVVEETSRANDPDFHIHNVVPNIVLSEDGQFRAMHNTLIFRHQKLAGAVFRAELAKGLRSMGLELESAGKHGVFEIKSIPARVRSLFSKRKKQIEKLFEQSHKDKAARDRIVLISRPLKQSLAVKDLKPHWDKELSTLETSFEKLTDDSFSKTISRHSPSLRSPAQMLGHVIQDLSDTQRSWTEFEMLQNALTRDIPEVTAKELLSEIEHKVDAAQLLKDGSHFSTPKILRQEAAIIKQLKRGQLRGRVIADKALTRTSDGLIPTDGQQNAADTILSARDRIIGVQGNAGVGKTTLIKLAAPMIQKKGLKLVGLAPTGAAVSALKEAGVFKEVMTTQRFCLAPTGNKSTVLVVDESSFLGTQSLLNILDFANTRSFAKVILMGDRNQLEGVEAGSPFADLQNAGMQTANVDQILRQKNARHRKAISKLANGEIQTGLQLYRPEVHIASVSEMNHQAVKLWQKTKDARTPIIVQTNAQKIDVNASIKSTLAPKGPGKVHQIWRAVHMTRSETARANSYIAGTHVRFGKHIKRMGFKKGEIYKIVSVDTQRSTVVLTDGRRKRLFLPAKYQLGQGTVELFEQASLELHVGDRIRFTRGARGQPTDNNDFGTVHSVNNKEITLILDKGPNVTLPFTARQLHHIDHGWATTCHAYQGKTVAQAIVIMPSQANPLTTLKSLYTGASRHKEGVAIVTDNISRLQNTIEHSLETRIADLKRFRPSPPLDKSKDAKAITTEDQERALAYETHHKNWSRPNNAQGKQNTPDSFKTDKDRSSRAIDETGKRARINHLLLQTVETNRARIKQVRQRQTQQRQIPQSKDRGFER